MAQNRRAGVAYEDAFQVKELDAGGQRFHNVSRVVATCEASGVEVVMDIQCELYRLKTKEKFTLALATTLDLQGKPDDGNWSPNPEVSLLDKFDYAMHGKIFRREALEGERVVVYVSHGGLLMKIKGNARFFSTLELDSKIYTLLKKQD
jgi:DNA-directed RNA polymerase I, II, and III subunit RPABC3